METTTKINNGNTGFTAMEYAFLILDTSIPFRLLGDTNAEQKGDFLVGASLS